MNFVRLVFWRLLLFNFITPAVKPRRSGRGYKAGMTNPTGPGIRQCRTNPLPMPAGGMFLNIPNYKANERGKGVHAVDPYITSQECSRCGEVVAKSLSTRTHICRHCGHTTNRERIPAENRRFVLPRQLPCPFQAARGQRPLFGIQNKHSLHFSPLGESPEKAGDVCLANVLEGFGANGTDLYPQSV